MLARFPVLQASFFAVSTALFGSSCQRSGETDSVPSAASSAPAFVADDPNRQWDSVISGNPGLSSDIVSALRRGADEESKALNPRTSLEERVPATISMARHQSLALGHYEDVFGRLEEGDTNLRRRVRGKIESLRLSLQSLEGMNRRFTNR